MSKRICKQPGVSANVMVNVRRAMSQLFKFTTDTELEGHFATGISGHKDNAEVGQTLTERRL